MPRAWTRNGSGRRSRPSMVPQTSTTSATADKTAAGAITSSARRAMKGVIPTTSTGQVAWRRRSLATTRYSNGRSRSTSERPATPSSDSLPPKVRADSPRASAVGQRAFSRSVQGRRAGVALATGGASVLGAAAHHDQVHEREHRQVLQDQQGVAGDGAQPQQREQHHGGSDHGAGHLQDARPPVPAVAHPGDHPTDMSKAISSDASSGRRVGNPSPASARTPRTAAPRTTMPTNIAATISR